MNNKETVIAVLAVLAIIAAYMWIWPNYRIWAHEMRGTAALVEARQNRKIRIEEAQANLEAERLNAEAEVVRAKGMAEAMEIEGGALTTEYIHYLWVRSNNFDHATTIYVPTETGLPVLESTRLMPGVSK